MRWYINGLVGLLTDWNSCDLMVIDMSDIRALDDGKTQFLSFFLDLISISHVIRLPTVTELSFNPFSDDEIGEPIFS